MTALDLLSWWRSVIDIFCSSSWWVFVPVVVLAVFSLVVRLTLRHFC